MGDKRRLTEVEESMVYVPILRTLATLVKDDCGRAGKFKHFVLYT